MIIKKQSAMIVVTSEELKRYKSQYKKAIDEGFITASNSSFQTFVLHRIIGLEQEKKRNQIIEAFFNLA